MLKASVVKQIGITNDNDPTGLVVDCDYGRLAAKTRYDLV
jgi:hypothetical protein